MMPFRVEVPAASTSGGHPLHVLLVDDSDTYAAAVAHILKQTPGVAARLSRVSTLAAADTAIALGGIDVVLLDLVLPDGNSCDWLLRQRERGEALPVIVLSDIDSDSVIVAALKAGAEDYLVKTSCDAAMLGRSIRYAVERHHVRQQLAQTGRRFRHLIDNALDLITIVETDGTVTYASPAAERLLGVPADALEGSTLWDLVHFDDVAPMQAMIETIVANPSASSPREFRVRAANGRWHTLEVIGQMMPETGGRQLVLNSRDVSERKRTEQALHDREDQLRQAQKLEAIGRLAGSIAHDFSNVLTIIIGAGERLADSLQAGDPRKRDLDAIRKGAEQATDMTQQLLAFSRRQVLAPAVLDVADVVNGVSRFLKPLIGERVQMRVAVGPNAGTIRADRTQFEQVVLNLAVNARDAMPDGGRLLISAQRERLTVPTLVSGQTLPPGDYALIEVSDTGVGMDTDVQARAFEPFFTTKDAGKGTGLGLSIVYGIVSQSGGVVKLTSAEGAGTTFSIYLPQAESPAVEPAAQKRERPVVGGTEAILLVEDQDDVRELVRDMLQLGGYSVFDAAGPSQAEQFCRDHDTKIDLLLTDVVMPEASGRELAERVRRWRPGTKVLFMSGYPEYSGTSHGPTINNAHFLPKPFDRRGLLTRVREVLDDSNL
jgi:two-component system, cell cycle sensor histidine kinase and response regulator CckA